MEYIQCCCCEKDIEAIENETKNCIYCGAEIIWYRGFAIFSKENTVDEFEERK